MPTATPIPTTTALAEDLYANLTSSLQIQPGGVPGHKYFTVRVEINPHITAVRGEELISATRFAAAWHVAELLRELACVKRTDPRNWPMIDHLRLFREDSSRAGLSQNEILQKVLGYNGITARVSAVTRKGFSAMLDIRPWPQHAGQIVCHVALPEL